MNKIIKQKIKDLLKSRKVSELNSMELREYLELSAEDFVERFSNVFEELAKE